jgi:hydrogenase maturation protein HypF
MLRIRINGIVQGVGFRPFVHNHALKLGLTGYVLNSSAGVEIGVEGREQDLTNFIAALRTQPPPAAKIDHMQVDRLPDAGYRRFEIRQSGKTDGSTFISPDLRVCQACLDELKDPYDQRYGYPFINCTNCGPRYSIIESTPYDRPSTSMKGFAMCAFCRGEYEDPANRRFHAQPVACPYCGPRLAFLDAGLQPVEGDPVANCLLELKQGNIVGIKGIGGFHLACDASNEAAVMELRKRKNRPAKPFAVMCVPGSLPGIVECSPAALELLDSPQAPIVLLPKLSPSPITEAVAPRNRYLGVFLPYAPHQHLLFDASGDSKPLFLVMTSGNVNDEPIARTEQELDGLCDCFLTHDRPILNECDDSVVVPTSENTVMIRRSRGYVPSPLSLPYDAVPTLGTGAELKISFCLADRNLYYMSPYIGNNGSKATSDFYLETLLKYQTWFRIKPELVACDLHPDYQSTRYAHSTGLPLVMIQHHHAHIAAVMAEHKLDEPVIGISYDGTGYGADGAIWGGEVFLADLSAYERKYHLNYLPLPGGDAAVSHPVRIAFAYLEAAGLESGFLTGITAFERQVIRKQLDNRFNLFDTSSMGRLFDSVSAMLGLFPEITFEAQSAIALEQLCENASPLEVPAYPYQLAWKEINVIPLLAGVQADILKGIGHELIALKFHRTIIDFTLAAVLELNRETRIGKVVLSGGVMQNIVLLEGLLAALRKAGLSVYHSSLLPANDGAIALGQAVIANNQRR